MLVCKIVQWNEIKKRIKKYQKDIRNIPIIENVHTYKTGMLRTLNITHPIHTSEIGTGPEISSPPIESEQIHLFESDWSFKAFSSVFL